jgi:transposase
MAMGLKSREEQQPLWVNATDLMTGPGHPFYEKLSAILAAGGFDDFVEEKCARFYAPAMGRPSIPPGVYFRALFIGYFERIGSERGIAWRCADSLALRSFLGYALDKMPPDHSSISRTRRKLGLETHGEVFGWVLRLLADEGLLLGKTLGIDATTLEANAALRSIVRRDTGDGYREFLEGLAKESGIETPTREDIAKIDRKRKGKGSNDEWESPSDPDAGISRMPGASTPDVGPTHRVGKDGRTRLCHKAEHAVDMASGAVVAVTLHRGEAGDTSSIGATMEKATENLERLEADGKIEKPRVREAVTDKGYHSNDTLVDFADKGWRTYVSEPRRGRRRWKNRERERDAVYSNRRRIRATRGKVLLRKRGELLERAFTHYLDGGRRSGSFGRPACSNERGGMRRTHLRRHDNILKRLLVHVAGFNLGLVMRKLVGCGTPKGLAAALSRLFDRLLALWGAATRAEWPEAPKMPRPAPETPYPAAA